MDRNPQAEQMAHESMLRNLAAQAQIIWPQEAPLFARYGLREGARIADIGCGSGEITVRLAEAYESATLVGVDILEAPLEHARRRAAGFGARIEFLQGDAFHLPFGDGEFDLVVCRHVTQAVPAPASVLAELKRVAKPGGWLHVLSEDYRMLHFPHGEGDGARDPDRLWTDGVAALARATHTDERVGRITWALLRALGLTDLRVDYAIVDTLRVPRATFAAVITAWRDGYAKAIAEHSRLSLDELRALFDCAIAAIHDESQYAVWHVPIISGQKA